MTRFEYLRESQKYMAKSAKKKSSISKIAAEQFKGQTIECVESLYVRKEMMDAVGKEIKYSEHDSASELVENLLLHWLKNNKRAKS